MSIEFLPHGNKCNLKCSYCYQEPMRIAGNHAPSAKLARATEVLAGLQQPFTLFGGEPLLTSVPELDQYFAIGYEKFKSNSIQTNGLLIGDAHIDLFKRYNVHVGLSLDGPGKLNSPRCDIADTERILYNIRRLYKERINWSLIVTIHRENATRIDRLCEFLDEMEQLGARGINLHNLELDYKAHEIALSPEENFNTFCALYGVSKESKVDWHPFVDIKNLLTRSGPANCVWNACDPLTTPAVQGVGADGNLYNCGRTNKEGVDWLKSSYHSSERYLALYHTPQEHGGCKDCRYFFACKGHCPGTAIDGDWRNRTRDCKFWFSLISFIELDLGLSIDHVKLNSEFISITEGRGNSSHIDSPHGDVPHGDEHGDHTDLTPRVTSGAPVTWIG
jgi:uncharacterized protein